MKKYIVIPLILAFILLIIPSVSADGSCLYVFYAKGCPHCANLESYIDENIKERFDVHINYIDANQESALFVRLLKDYEVPMERWGLVPAAFVGDYYCIGDTPCIENLENEIIKSSEMPCPDGAAHEQDSIPEDALIIPVDFTFAGITGLALVDAINPCALAVLIILLSTILLRDPKKKKKALLSGLAFSASVFLLYFLMGVLIVFGLKWVTSVSSLSTAGLYKAFGVFAIIIGLLNIKDYWKYGAGGFIMEVPRRWRSAMTHFLKSVTSIKGAFIVGIIVSLFLLPCTAGPYFVAGGLLSGVSWVTAIPWLAYYNFLFVLPMIAITIFVYGSFTAVEEVSGWRERNIRRLHLVAGIILVGLGIAMVTGLV